MTTCILDQSQAALKEKSIHIDIVIAIKTVADLGGAVMCAPFEPLFLYFHGVLGKFGPVTGWRPLLRRRRYLGNIGSTTEKMSLHVLLSSRSHVHRFS